MPNAPKRRRAAPPEPRTVVVRDDDYEPTKEEFDMPGLSDDDDYEPTKEEFDMPGLSDDEVRRRLLRPVRLKQQEKVWAGGNRDA